MRAAQTFASELVATASVTGLRMAGAALSFALAMVLSAMLGASGAGVFYASLSWGMALALVALWGAPQLILHEIPPLIGNDGELRPGPAMRTMFAGNVIRFVFLAALLALFAWVYSPGAMRSELALDYRFAIVIGLLMLVLRSACEGAKALGHPQAATLVEFAIAPGLTLAIILAAFALFTPRFAELAALYAASLCAAAAIGALFLLFRLGDWSAAHGPLPKNWAHRRNVFAQIEIGQFLTSVGAVAFLPLVMTAADVGVFNLVLRIAALVSLVRATIPTISLPRLARARSDGDGAGFERTLRSLRIIMAVAGISAFGAIVLLGPAILQIAGAEFAGGASALPWAAAGFCAALALGPAGTELTLLGKERAMRNAILPLGILGIAATLVAGWLGGMTAAAAMPGAAAFLAKAIQLALVMRARALPDGDIA